MKARLKEFLNFISARTVFSKNRGLLLLDGSAERNAEALALLQSLCPAGPNDGSRNTSEAAALFIERDCDDNVSETLRRCEQARRALIVAGSEWLLDRSSLPLREFDGVLRVSMIVEER